MAIYKGMQKVSPGSPVFLLTIGKTEFTLENSPEKGQYFVSFSMTRSATGDSAYDSANDIVLKLFDETALLVEWELLKGSKKVSFQFGQDNTNLSRIFSAHVDSYEPEFLANGSTILTIVLKLGTGASSSDKAKTYKGSPSDIIKQIAKEEGWIVGKITSCKAIEGESYNRTSQTAMEFIQKELVPKAQSKDGKSGFKAYTDSDDKGRTIINFVAVDENNAGDIKTYEIVIGGPSNNWAKDAEVVISFVPTYNGLLQTLFTEEANAQPDATPKPKPDDKPKGKEEPKSDGNDSKSKDKSKTDVNDAKNKPSDNLTIDIPALDDLTNKLIPTYKGNGNFKRTIGTSSYSNDEMGRIAEYFFTRLAKLGNTAQLVLRGDAKIDPMNFISITVLTPDGFFHHSSGLYQVLEVVDDIEGGLYTTTLNLIRVPMTIGADGSISVIPPEEAITVKGNGSGANGGLNAGSGSVETPSGSASESKLRSIADQYYIGLPYVWGANHGGGNITRKSSYDCSSFCTAMVQEMGYSGNLGTTATIIGMPNKVEKDKSKLQPGDLLVWRKGGQHVVMVVNQSTIVHAPTSGDVIKYASIDWAWGKVTSAGSQGAVIRVL